MKDKKAKICISIDPELLAKIKQMAEAENRPLSNMLEVLLREQIEK
ncbi:MAG: ribbon-helix-helix protein, CopG family [Paludibacteraceae bacterium]|jgi:hypothetical protein|nr:ribbon-helix-helix protein, CopG family [Paludibacteraceae bacterium]